LQRKVQPTSVVWRRLIETATFIRPGSHVTVPHAEKRIAVATNPFSLLSNLARQNIVNI